MLQKNLLVALTLLVFQICAAAEQGLRCPAEIEPDMRLGTQLQWELFVPGDAKDKATRTSGAARRLQGMQVYAGHPRDEASLVPDRDKKLKASVRESTWRLAGEHWIGCSYADTSTLLIRPVPASATECRMSYQVKRGDVQVLAFRCNGNNP
jgi:hypothetical protein